MPPAPLYARHAPHRLRHLAHRVEVDESYFGGYRKGKASPLKAAVDAGKHVILYGPPGTGKTTLGRLIAGYTDREFVPFSSVTEGVPRIREVVAEAERRLQLGRGTILFTGATAGLRGSAGFAATVVASAYSA